jgi:apolipoprotein N-acyltransferase
VAFIVVAVNALIAVGWRVLRRRRARAIALWGTAGAVVAAPLLFPSAAAAGPAIRVAVVQGNVPRQWSGSIRQEELHILRSHERLTEALSRARPQLVVWPESSVGLDPQRSTPARTALADAARRSDATMIVGADLRPDPSHYEVVALEVSPKGAIVDRYQKTHLVPFGEYVPARRWLGWIPMLDQIPIDAVPGRVPTLFRVPRGVVAPVISFEGDFGSLVRRRIALGGRLLVVATNTSTWGSSWASAQHVASSQVRAAENGVWVVHAALSGISAVIGPDGVVRRLLPLWTRASMVTKVRFATGPSFYARTGDWLPLASIVAGGAGVVLGVGRPRARTHP